MKTKGRYRSRQAAQSSTHRWGTTHSMSELPLLLQRRPIIPQTRPSPAQHCCCCCFQSSQRSVSHPFKHLCMTWAQLCKEQQSLDEGQRGRLLKPRNQLHLHAGGGGGRGQAVYGAARCNVGSSKCLQRCLQDGLLVTGRTRSAARPPATWLLQCKHKLSQGRGCACVDAASLCDGCDGCGGCPFPSFSPCTVPRARPAEACWLLPPPGSAVLLLWVLLRWLLTAQRQRTHC